MTGVNCFIEMTDKKQRRFSRLELLQLHSDLKPVRSLLYFNNKLVVVYCGWIRGRSRLDNRRQSFFFFWTRRNCGLAPLPESKNVSRNTQNRTVGACRSRRKALRSPYYTFLIVGARRFHSRKVLVGSDWRWVRPLIKTNKKEDKIINTTQHLVEGWLASIQRIGGQRSMSLQALTFLVHSVSTITYQYRTLHNPVPPIILYPPPNFLYFLAYLHFCRIYRGTSTLI